MNQNHGKNSNCPDDLDHIAFLLWYQYFAVIYSNAHISTQLTCNQTPILGAVAKLTFFRHTSAFCMSKLERAEEGDEERHREIHKETME